MSEYTQTLRSLVGTMPLILVGAVVVIQNENKQILLQHRKDGNWGLPGGLMEPGESLEETAIREVYEETGLNIYGLTMLEIFSGRDFYLKLLNGDELYSVTAMFLSLDYSGSLISDPTESYEVNFFDLQNMPKLNFANSIYIDKYIQILD